MTPVKWLLVGAGDIARKRVAPALADADNSQIVAICDTRPEAAQDLAAQHQVESLYSDYGEALEQSGAQAVYLATPVSLHVPQLLQALESGKHVLVEKPLGMNAQDCQIALEAARRSKVVTGCAYYRRLYPAYTYIQSLLADGELGDLLLAQVIYHSWFNPEPGEPKYWRVERAKSGGGPLSDMATHMFDLLIGLVGLPKRVEAQCQNRWRTWDVEDSAGMLMQWETGMQGMGYFSWCSQTWQHRLEIIGSKARIEWSPVDAGTLVKTSGRQVDSISLPPAVNVHQPLVEDFIQAIQSGRHPIVPLEEAAKTNLLLDAIYQSSQQQHPVPLEASHAVRS